MIAICPSDLALEDVLLGDGVPSKYAPQVGSCAACQARLAQMEREGQEFLQYVFPATVRRVEEAAAGAHAGWMRWLRFLPVPAAAALVALLVVVARPGSA